MNISSGRATIRSTVVVLAVAALAVAAAVTVVPRANTAAAQVAVAVEDDGADCPVPNPGPLTANPLLPDPFTKVDGTRVSTRDEWRCRRAEIKELAEQFVYGQKPPPPDSVTGTVSTSSITVNVTDNGRSASFSAGVRLPNGSGPFPALVVIGGLGADTSTILSTGVAVINYNPFAVGAEGTPRSNKQGAFYSIYGSPSSTGLLVAWAWGVSRIIDVIEQSGGAILRADAMGVTGCSRYGKGAFVTGAFDQRIALTMPIESGSAGAPIFRGIPGESGAQPLSSAYGEQPWLGDAFGSFTGNPTTLPVDTHEIVGMIAPRGLFIMDNPHIDWLAARSGSVAALAGAEVYTALGARENITYWSDIQDGSHCASRPEWRTPLVEHLQKFLLGTGNAAGTIRISPAKAGNLSDWRTWQTPILAGGPTTPPATTPPATTPPATTPPATTPPATTPPATTPPVTTTPPGEPGGCTATYQQVNSWPGGFQAAVTVSNNGAATLDGWSFSLGLPSGVTISNLWNGEPSDTSGPITVSNAGYNGTIPANGSVEVGFVAAGSSSPSPTVGNCTSP